MPFSTPHPRKHLHDRHVHCQGFLREDGLWDIEGYMEDTKTYSIPSHDRIEIKPGEPLHGMGLRITLDNELTIVEAEATMDATPFNLCPKIAPEFADLKGIQIARGWRKEVRRRFGGRHGCTHLVELLGPMATVAFQTVFSYRHRDEDVQYDRKPPHLDTCHALASDSEVVKRIYPEWYEGDEAKERGSS